MVNNPKRKPKNKGVTTKLPLNSEIRALIFHNNDKNPKEVKIKKYSDDFFNSDGRSYLIDFDDTMFFKRNKLLWGSILYLFYYYDNDRPLRVDEKLRNINDKRIPNSVIYTALQSDAIKKAHDINKNNFIQDNLTMLLVVGGIAIVLYFMFGG